MSDSVIGTVSWDGKEYEIDWPFDLGDLDVRDESYAVVYLDGVQVADFCPPGFAGFDSEEHVLAVAFEFISQGGLDDE